MKNLFQKNTWISSIIIVMLFISFCYNLFEVLQLKFSGAPDIVVKFYRIESSLSLCVLICFLCLYRMAIFYDYKTKSKSEISRQVENLYPNFAPHQQRVLEERDELNDKYLKLLNFIHHNQLYKGLSGIEQLTLKKQLDHMSGYLAVLNTRINRF
ncbi:crAss001_48 related protein [Empedobacter brevis]